MSEEDQLRADLSKERELRLKLEDDCDLLALENIRLRGELETLRASIKTNNPELNLENDVELVKSNNELANNDNDFLIEGDGLYPDTVVKTITNACNSKNITTLAFCYNFSYIICGGADNSIHVYSISGDYHWTDLFSSPATRMASFDNYTACSLLDGTTLLVINYYCISVPAVD